MVVFAAAPASALDEGPVGSDTGDTVSPVEGLDLSAEADDQTGAARTRVPLAVPPGRGGLEPKLVLTYSSQRGSGLFGPGWDLTLGRIERSTRIGAPRYDGTDMFVAVLPGGAYELVPLADGSFGARIDDAHFRAVVVGNGWQLHEKNGRTWEFGTAAGSRAGPNSSAFGTTFAWHLSRVTDLNGNTLTVSYYPDNGNGYPLPLDIAYGGHTSGLSPTSIVHFAWNPRSAPARPIYTGGFRQLPASYLAQISETFGGAPVRSYVLDWGTSSINGGIVLSRVRQLGSDGSELRTVDSQPAGPSFAYYPATLPQGSGPDLLHGSQINADLKGGLLGETYSEPWGDGDLNCTRYTFLDLNGDGLPDAIKAYGWTSGNQNWTVYFNQGNATFGDGVAWPSPSWCIVYESIVGIADPDHNRRDETIRASTAVMDMNGDGRPDLVRIDPSKSAFIDINWNTGSGFDPTPQLWSAPGVDQVKAFRDTFRHYEDTNDYGQYGTATVEHTQTDLIDLNGDGRPDWVTTGGWTAANDTWTVRWNLGDGFSNPQPFTAYRHWIRDGAGENAARNTDADVFDVNGDGLVDYVVAAGRVGGVWEWDVWYGTGRGFAGADASGSAFPIAGGPRARLRSWNSSDSRFEYDVLDVNGDRLPDFVDSTGWTTSNPRWLVYRNTGASIDPNPIPWDAPAPLRRNLIDAVGSVITSDTFDLDGNGYPDIIEKSIGETVAKVWLYHPLPYRPDTLSVVTSALGGQTDLTYAVSTTFNHGDAAYVDPNLGPGYHGLPFPVFVVTFLQRWAPDLGADGWSLTEYAYDGGAWAADRREFRGFRTVTKQDHYGALETTVYHQSDALHGRVLERGVSNQSSIGGTLRLTQNSWTAVPVGNRWVPELRQVTRTDFSSGSGQDVPWTTGIARATAITYTYDPCGNAVQQVTTGEGVSVTQTANFAVEPHNTCTAERVCPSRFCDRPATTQTTDPVGGRPLTQSFAYDSRRNTTSITQVGLDGPTTAYAYDPTDGRLTQVIDPKGFVTTISYDPVWSLFPYDTVKDANGARLTTRTEFDGRFGKLSRTTDPNGAVAQYGYDVFGRRTAIAEPGQTLVAPTTWMDYFIGVSGGSGLRVDTSQREPKRASKYIVSSTFYDGLGRMLQTQTVREVNGAEKVVVTAGRKYIAGGRVEREYEPLVAAVLDPRTPAGLAGAPATVISYDDFSRPIRRTTADGRSSSVSRAFAWVTRRCDFNHESDPSGTGGRCVDEEDDGVGRLRYQRKYFGAVARFLEMRSYDGASRILTKTQQDLVTGKQAVTRYSYDTLGRKATMVDPDSGTWSYGYDKNGNLTYENDPKSGQHLEAEYDGLNRMRWRREYDADALGAGTATEVATYTYDTAVNGKGRVGLVTDQSGATSFEQYDLRGNVQRSIKTITYLDVTRRFATVSQFDEIGRMISSTYPYPNASQVERFVYDYSALGRLVSVGSDHGTYLTSQQHDERGRLTNATYGNNVHDVYAYAGATGAFRLQRLTTQKAGSAQPYRDLQYADYDRNGNVRLVRDLLYAPTSPVSQSEAVSYDDGSRVTHLWQCGGSRYDTDIRLDLLDDLEQKDQQSYAYSNPAPHAPSAYGPDPISYDPNGSMTGLPGSRTITYDAQHRVQMVEAGGAQWTYVYDYAGTRVVSDTPTGTTFFFGAFDVRGDQITRHVMAGTRIIASSVVSGGNTILAQAYTEAPIAVATTLWGTALALGLGLAAFMPLQRGRRTALAMSTLLLASDVVIPSPATAQCPGPQLPPGTIFYHVDHLGTPQLLTDEAGNVVEYLVTRPYGASAGSFDAMGASVASRSPFRFTGARADDGSGLLYFRARHYDPELGMFTTLDPAQQFSSPYSYGGGNPVNGTDPSGARWEFSFGFDDWEDEGEDVPGDAEFPNWPVFDSAPDVDSGSLVWVSDPATTDFETDPESWDFGLADAADEEAGDRYAFAVNAELLRDLSDLMYEVTKPEDTRLFEALRKADIGGKLSQDIFGGMREEIVDVYAHSAGARPAFKGSLRGAAYEDPRLPAFLDRLGSKFIPSFEVAMFQPHTVIGTGPVFVGPLLPLSVSVAPPSTVVFYWHQSIVRSQAFVYP